MDCIVTKYNNLLRLYTFIFEIVKKFAQ